MSANPFIHDEADAAKRLIFSLQNLKSQCSIAKVSSINATPVSVNIQPLVNYFDTISGWEQYPVLNFVPVAQMQTSKFSFNLPLNVGDIGIVLWFDREVYTCLLNGATTPTIPDSGDLSDTNACVFIPMMQPFGLANTLLPSGVDIISSQISLLTQLLSTMNNISTTLTDISSLLTALSTFAVACEASTTDPILVSAATALAAALPSIATSISSVATSITSITTNLTTFKGGQP